MDYGGFGMTEKRFKQLTGKGFTYAFIDTENLDMSYLCDNEIDCKNIVELLNELHEEKEQYKALLQDMGVILSDTDIINIRQQISDKIIVPLIEDMGCPVESVDVSDGFNVKLKDRKKVEAEDIIGIVKTDEPTNSVDLKKELYK
jgi:hypothetical protein